MFYLVTGSLISDIDASAHSASPGALLPGYLLSNLNRNILHSVFSQESMPVIRLCKANGRLAKSQLHFKKKCFLQSEFVKQKNPGFSAVVESGILFEIVCTSYPFTTLTTCTPPRLSHIFTQYKPAGRLATGTSLLPWAERSRRPDRSYKLQRSMLYACKM